LHGEGRQTSAVVGGVKIWFGLAGTQKSNHLIINNNRRSGPGADVGRPFEVQPIVVFKDVGDDERFFGGD
jgi:hypothetical protein